MDKFINYESEEFKELLEQIEQSIEDVQDVRDKHRPTLADERYLSGEEVMEYLHISPRTLQTLRDKRMICYTTIGGKILYPEKELQQVLHNNYQSPELPFWWEMKNNTIDMQILRRGSWSCHPRIKWKQAFLMLIRDACFGLKICVIVGSVVFVAGYYLHFEQGNRQASERKYYP